jgi:hypothetical protein
MPADPHNNITIYEIWGEEESEWVDLCVKVIERKSGADKQYPN